MWTYDGNKLVELLGTYILAWIEGAELEAELLTGKDLNLEKAREAALNNDIATLSKEIGKNSVQIQITSL